MKGEAEEVKDFSIVIGVGVGRGVTGIDRVRDEREIGGACA